MSKKGWSQDNSACEGFFGLLKNKMFYDRHWANFTIDQFIEKLDSYLRWYSHKRRKLTLGGLSPIQYNTIQYRKSLGLIVV